MICIGKQKGLLLQQVLSKKSLSHMFEFHREKDIGDPMFFEDCLECTFPATINLLISSVTVTILECYLFNISLYQRTKRLLTLGYITNRMT